MDDHLKRLEIGNCMESELGKFGKDLTRIIMKAKKKKNKWPRLVLITNT